MKQVLLAAAFSTAALAGFGQTDSTQKEQNDTIKVGTMTIIKKKDGSGGSTEVKSSGETWKYSHYNKGKKLETTWFNFDFGFNNFVDNTDYNSAEAKQYARATRPGEPQFGSSDFNLRTGKSINTNIWIFRQKYAFTKDRVARLTYGLYLETNNYRFDTELKTSYKNGNDPYVWRDSISFTKNKLAADYITVPLMIGFDTKPGHGGFTMSAGVSVGYLYNSRNKQISAERGKQKIRGNFDMEPWKFQVIGEMGFGPVKLYATYSPNSMYKRGLEHLPYNVGFRFGDWDL